MTQQQSTKRSKNSRIALQLGILGAAIGIACIAPAANAQDPNAGHTNNNMSQPAVESGRITPLANTTVLNARAIVPDGTSLAQGYTSGETRWFVFGGEQGKTYTVEALDPYSDRDSNGVSLSLFDIDGTSPPPEATVNCGMQAIAPAFDQFTGGTDGARCVIRMFVPTGGTTLNQRGLYVAVTMTHTGTFQVRVRESTLYGRWTTNGYDFHVELQNTTTNSICVNINRYPGTGTTPPTGLQSQSTLTIPPMGANKVIFANGSLVNGDNKGTLRIHDCGDGSFVPGSLHLNTYAYNPVTNLFIPFSNTSANGGTTNNTW